MIFLFWGKICTNLKYGYVSAFIFEIDKNNVDDKKKETTTMTAEAASLAEESTTKISKTKY